MVQHIQLLLQVGKMYENGEMAPMAYTYLMYLTYQWWLADTDDGRQVAHARAEEFRKNKYLTTNGKVEWVDEGIAFMLYRPVLPPDIP